MSTTIDQSFVKQFESEFHLQFQKTQSDLRSFVRTKTGVVGSSTTFQKIGTGAGMVSKSRHGEVPTDDIDHTPIEVVLADRYTAEDVDKLDELKIAHDERAALMAALTANANREVDNIITAAMDASNTAVGGAAGAMSLTKALDAFKTIGENSAISGGNMYAPVSYHTWAQLLGIDSFANADFVSADNLPFNTVERPKMWLGAMWFPMNGLPKSGDDRSNFYYNSMGVGFAIGADVRTDVWWNGDKQAHRITVYLSMGATTIDALGVGRFLVDETSALPT